MKKIVTLLGFKFNLTQYEWGRKWFGGTYYYIYPRFLSMGSFWSDQPITSCGSEILDTKVYN